MTAFDRAFGFTYQWEKGLVDDPDDPGGLTKDGISDRSDGKIDGKYDGKPIKELTLEDEKAIYKMHYWDVMHCDDRPLSYAVAVFDTAVNCGIARTALWLEDSKDVTGFLKHRENHYQSIVLTNKKLAKFLKGWMNRLNALHTFVMKIDEEQKS